MRDEAAYLQTDDEKPAIIAEPRPTQQRLYQLIRQRGPVNEHTFEITFLDPGIQANAFTFG